MWLPLIVVGGQLVQHADDHGRLGRVHHALVRARAARPERAHRPARRRSTSRSPRRCSRSRSRCRARSGGGARRRRARAVYDGLIYARIILPEVVFATALFFLFLKIHFTLGLTAIVIGHTVWNSAYAAIIMQARMAGLDPALEEAAADLGATPWRTFRRVTLLGADARDHRRRAARVHVLVRRRGHVGVPAGRLQRRRCRS